MDLLVCARFFFLYSLANCIIRRWIVNLTLSISLAWDRQVPKTAGVTLPEPPKQPIITNCFLLFLPAFDANGQFQQSNNSYIPRFQASNRILMGLGYPGADQRHHQTSDCWRCCRSSQSYNRQPTGAHEDSISGKRNPIRATCFLAIVQKTPTLIFVYLPLSTPGFFSHSFVFVDLDRFFPLLYDH